MIEGQDFNGSFVSSNISLPVATGYTLTAFMVLDNNDSLLYATPVTGSKLAPFVTTPLPISFDVTAGGTPSLVTPEVLPTTNQSSLDFGYFGFKFTIKNVEYANVGVQVADANSNSFVLTEGVFTLSSGGSTVVSQNLTADINLVGFISNATDFTITIEKSGYETYTKNVTKNELLGYGTVPLIAILSESSNSIPYIDNVPTNTTPTPPAGQKVAVIVGPNNGTPSPNSPVIRYQGYTYYAYSYVDNRVAMNIVAYDSNGNIVGQWPRSGARYVYKMEVDETNQTVKIFGQADNIITLTWAELIPVEVPKVVMVPKTSHPAIPAGLKITGPDPFPTVQYKGVTFWPYSFIDNRVATALVGYDSNGNVVKTLEKSGARYAESISVDEVNEIVVVTGQASSTVQYTWAELE